MRRNYIRQRDLQKVYEQQIRQDEPYWVDKDGNINDWFSGIITENIDIVTTLNFLHLENQGLKKNLDYRKKVIDHKDEELAYIKKVLWEIMNSEEQMINKFEHLSPLLRDLEFY